MAADFGNDVKLILGGREALIVTNYSVRLSMLTQPAEFRVSLGHSAVVRQLIDRYPPGTPFELYVAGARQFKGQTDGWSVSGSAGTSFELHGRDTLARLHDSCVEAETSYKDVAYVDLVKAALDKVYGASSYTLVSSNDANRKVMSGTSGSGSARPKNSKKTQAGIGIVGRVAEGALPDDDNPDNSKLTDRGVDIVGRVAEAAIAAPGAQRKTIQAKLGMRWYAEFIKPQLDRAGLFLWAAESGDFFILSALNTDQAPICRLSHRRGERGNLVKAVAYSNDTRPRYSRCEVWGRRGGGKEPRSKVSALFADEEMAALGLERPLVVQDDKTTSIKQAEFLARRRIAESRRQGWKLAYTIGGHKLPLVNGRGEAVVVPDSVIEVNDEEIGVHGNFYVETVEHASRPHAETSITLMRPEDVVFGENEEVQ